MTEQSLAHGHKLHGNHAHGPETAHRRKAARRPKSGFGRWVAWEWAIVLVLLAGLSVALLVMSRGPDPKGQANALIDQMKAAALGRPLGAALFGGYPAIARNDHDLIVTMQRVPPKVCVLASWELYRYGAITVNGVSPLRVSAAKLVELCNTEETATLSWSPKPLN